MLVVSYRAILPSSRPQQHEASNDNLHEPTVYCTRFFVTAAASFLPVSHASAQLYGPDTCVQGYVWREAVPNDHVCVTPQERAMASEQNRLAAQRRVAAAPDGHYIGKVRQPWAEPPRRLPRSVPFDSPQ
jgi:hypothetical protein